jgi:5'(3')-deoxyribonucleotidase
MRVGIDIDGVLRDHLSQMFRVYLEEFKVGPAMKIPEQEVYSLSDTFSLGYEWWGKERAKEIFMDAIPYQGALKFMDDLSQDGHAIVIVTKQSNDQLKKFALGWLLKYNIKFNDFLILQNKANSGVDILLDDSVDNLTMFSAKGKAVCMDRLYNQEWTGLRVKTYNEFINLLKAQP